ncbi:porphobilinogen deaminase-like [Gigantopelta aegis]|uniref:porphobilinogen deaminase-like n=1 Tax=Gigantopelta aegis TaxID=1735272 RepID=UPI001B8895ED|nr:porphobilinogen deaminase-like [Gigantopelta aegis]
MSDRKTMKVGSRKSQLALIQTNKVISKLKELHPDFKFEVVTMTTTGDRILDSALSKIGEKSLFTKELEVALVDKSVDFVVHSLKDLPTALPDGLAIGCVYKRDSPCDAVVMHPKNEGETLQVLTVGILSLFCSVIGTSSLRRCAQIRRRYPKLVIDDIRGNLNTRFRKLDSEGRYDAIILAEAGLHRMSWSERISEVLSPEDCMYAVSQGAMAVECRAGDLEIINMLNEIHDPDTAIRCIAERAFLKHLEGGCSVPVAVDTQITDNKLTMRGGVFSVDGREAVEESSHVIFSKASGGKLHNGNQLYASIVGCLDQDPAKFVAAEKLGTEIAETMVNKGADSILRAAKRKAEEEILEEHARKRARKEASPTLQQAVVS